MKKRLFVVMIAVLPGAFGTVFAGRPLAVNDTEPVENGMWQIEASGDYWKDSSQKHADIPFTLDYGLLPDVDLTIGFGGQYNREKTDGATCCEHGCSDLYVYPRWKFLDQSDFLPSQAVSFTVKFPTASCNRGLGSGGNDYNLTWIASEKIGKDWQVDANIGYSWIGAHADADVDGRNLILYGVALEYQLSESVQWVGEAFAQREMGSDGETTAQYDSGFRWSACENLTFDIAAGSKICGEAPDFYATAGLTWVFGLEKKESLPPTK
jgi:hypothetical protein